MLRAMLSAAICAAPLLAQGVVINEFVYDDAGTDSNEFVEVYNASGVTVDMTGWTLEGIDGTSSGNGTYSFPAGLMLMPGDFWVVGSVPGAT